MYGGGGGNRFLKQWSKTFIYVTSSKLGEMNQVLRFFCPFKCIRRVQGGGYTFHGHGFLMVATSSIEF